MKIKAASTPRRKSTDWGFAYDSVPFITYSLDTDAGRMVALDTAPEPSSSTVVVVMPQVRVLH